MAISNPAASARVRASRLDTSIYWEIYDYLVAIFVHQLATAGDILILVLPHAIPAVVTIWMITATRLWVDQVASVDATVVTILAHFKEEIRGWIGHCGGA